MVAVVRNGVRELWYAPVSPIIRRCNGLSPPTQKNLLPEPGTMPYPNNPSLAVNEDGTSKFEETLQTRKRSSGMKGSRCDMNPV